MNKLSILLGAGLVLAACGNQDHESHQAKNKTESEKTEISPVKVVLTAPDKIDAGKETVLKAEVTQGKQKINDADEVMFEVIKDEDKKNSDKKMVKDAKDGIYELPYTFKEDGTYKVISHVTAKDQHTMPSKTVIVGHVHEEGHSAHHHHEGGIHIMPITAEKGKKTDMMIHVQDAHEQPAAGIMARMEVTAPDGKVDWVDMKETKKGQYEGTTTFDQQGTYHAKAHAEGDNGFHVHEETDFEVK